MHILFDLALKAKDRSLFKCRIGEIDDVRIKFSKHYNNIISTLLNALERNVEHQEMIREGFIKEYFEVESISEDLFNDYI